MNIFKLTKENLTEENINNALHFLGTVEIENVDEVRNAVKAKIEECSTEQLFGGILERAKNWKLF